MSNIIFPVKIQEEHKTPKPSGPVLPTTSPRADAAPLTSTTAVRPLTLEDVLEVGEIMSWVFK